MNIDKWEYQAVDTVISFWGSPEKQITAWLANLNELGQEGWELVSDTVIQTKGTNATQYPILLFKRRLL